MVENGEKRIATDMFYQTHISVQIAEPLTNLMRRKKRFSRSCQKVFQDRLQNRR